MGKGVAAGASLSSRDGERERERDPPAVEGEEGTRPR